MLQRANGGSAHAHDSNRAKLLLQTNTQTSSAANGVGAVDEYQRYVVPGIQNLGNTCFFNAILQALASVSSFQEYLDEVVRQSKFKGHGWRVPFTSALRDCIDELAPTVESEPRPAVVPRRLNAELVTKLAAFRGNKQQDSQELLQFLMNLVTDEQKRCALRDVGLQDLRSDFLAKSISDLRHEESVRNRKCWNPMHGLQVNLLQCTRCRRYRPMRNHRFLDVSLSFSADVPPAPSSGRSPSAPVTLVDCLRRYTEPEAIDGVECSFCSLEHALRVTKHEFASVKRQLDHNKASADDVALEIAQHERSEWLHTLERALAACSTSDGSIDLDALDGPGPVERIRQRCHKRLQFSRSPDVFCFHFNRKVFHAWSGSARKLDTHVAFPLTLDMSAFCTYEQAASEDRTLGTSSLTATVAAANANANGRVNGRVATTTPSASAFVFAVPPKAPAAHLVYDLKAVILHQGNERCGHFTAFRRLANGQWFFLSDDSVRSASQDEVLASCAYMLFYERRYRASRDLSTTLSTDDDDSLPDVPFECA